MTPKQLTRLAAALALVLALWGTAALARRLDRDEEPRFTLPEVDTSAVDSILLTRPEDTSRLVRTETGAWRVNGRSASASAVADLLVALRDSGAGGELVARSRRSHERLGVDSAGGRRLRVAGDGRVLADLVLGDRTRDFDGVYARRSDGDEVYVLRGGFAGLVDRAPDDWRDKRIVGVEPDSVAAIEVARGRSAYTLRRTAEGWRFASGAAADSGAVARLLNEFRGVSAAGFADSAQGAAARFDRPDRRVRLVGPGGRHLAALAFDSGAAGLWVRHDTGGTVYRMDAWQADRLTPHDSTLRKRE